MSDNQEAVFKFLWHDKCWEHDWMYSECEAFGKEAYCRKCHKWMPETSINPDLSTWNGMGMILGRLVEMGYSYALHGTSLTKICRVLKKIDTEEEVDYWMQGKTLPEATLNAVSELIRKEREDGR